MDGTVGQNTLRQPRTRSTASEGASRAIRAGIFCTVRNLRFFSPLGEATFYAVPNTKGGANFFTPSQTCPIFSWSTPSASAAAHPTLTTLPQATRARLAQAPQPTQPRRQSLWADPHPEN